jgi:hypothetical protein
VLEFVGTLWEFKEVLIALALGFGAVKVPMMGLKLVEFAGTLTTMGGAAATAAKPIRNLGGLLGKGGLVAAAGAAGIAIGTLIKKLANKKQGEQLKRGNKSVELARNLGTASNEELERRMKNLNIKEKKVWTYGGVMSDILSGGSETRDAMENIQTTKRQIEAEQIRRLEIEFKELQRQKSGQAELESLPTTRGGAPMMPGGIGPLKVAERAAKQRGAGAGAGPVMETKTETVTKEQVEVVLKDETAGRATVTKQPKGKNFKLVHTGAPN